MDVEPLGAANSTAVASCAGSWELQRKAALQRFKQLDLPSFRVCKCALHVRELLGRPPESAPYVDVATFAGPRGLQDGPRWPQDGPERGPRRGTRNDISSPRPQEAPRRPSEAPKNSPRGSKGLPRSFKRTTKKPPRSPHRAPKQPKRQRWHNTGRRNERSD